jgi:iron complex transport system substrate-binding protein
MRVVLSAIVAMLFASSASALTLVDMRGRSLTFAAPPQRIVSLVPSVTETIFALGAEARLAGVTDFCDFPPAAKAKPSVGGMIAPSLETIVTLGADVVIGTDAGSRVETFAALHRLGVPVYLVHANRLADVFGLVERLGALTGREGAAPVLIARLRERVEVVTRAVKGRARPRVLYVLWPEPLIVPGRDDLVTELIQLAGGDSVTGDEPHGYPRLSLEAAVARAPDVIVLARHGTGSGPIPREKWDRLTSLPAVRAGRVHAVDGNLLHRYGPRIVDGLMALARIIHPEAWP